MNVPLGNPISFIQVLGITTRKAFILVSFPLVKIRASWGYQPCLISPFLPACTLVCIHTGMHTHTHTNTSLPQVGI